MTTRREVLSGTFAIAAAAACGRAMAGEERSLGAIGREKGIEIGTAFSVGGTARQNALVREHCALIVPEWQLKPQHLRPDPAEPYRFAEADAVASFARDNAMTLHGHTLFWHASPLGGTENAQADTAIRRYGKFIGDVVTRYRDCISWDVVNEIVEERTLLRAQPILDRLGLDFVDHCFREVRNLAPDAKLAINDYNLSCADRWCSAKRDNMLKVLEQLLAIGTPVDALGIQAHLSSRFAPDSRETLRFIRKVEALGLDVYISEIDVNDIDFPDDIAARDRTVADIYEEFLATVLESPAVKRVVFWGLFDARHWHVLTDIDDTRGADARPALFDRDDRPKPAFDAVRRALEGAAARS